VTDWTAGDRMCLEAGLGALGTEDLPAHKVEWQQRIRARTRRRSVMFTEVGARASSHMEPSLFRGTVTGRRRRSRLTIAD
jgi:hypothetical protein